MALVEIMLVGVGGFLGSIIRYLLSKRLNSRKGFPFGTLFVNLVGSLLIGFVFGLELSRSWTFLLASGLAGALTTFSTMNKEILLLWESDQKRSALLYILLTYTSGIVLAWTGFIVGDSF